MGEWKIHFTIGVTIQLVRNPESQSTFFCNYLIGIVVGIEP
jgi:hypothetical protein